MMSSGLKKQTKTNNGDKITKRQIASFSSPIWEIYFCRGNLIVVELHSTVFKYLLWKRVLILFIDMYVCVCVCVYN